MPSQAARRRPLALMWPPAARWSEHLAMLVVRDTRGCELDEHESAPGRRNAWRAAKAG